MTYVGPPRAAWPAQIANFHLIFQGAAPPCFDELVQKFENEEYVPKLRCTDDWDFNYVPIRDASGCYLVRVRITDDGAQITLTAVERIPCDEAQWLLNAIQRP